ncbi:MAG: hypothetical protein WDZ65_00475, partial [Aquisalimonadaceae bacterium]
LETLALLSELRFAEGEAQARELVQTHLRRGLDDLFTDLSARLPAFADWYYSLSGDYARLSMLVLEKANLVDGGYEARKAQEIVFDGADFDDRLEILRLQTDSRLSTQATATREGWLMDMLEALSGDRQPVAPLDSSTVTSMDALLSDLSGYDSPEFVARISASTVAGVGVGAGAGMLLSRAISRRAAAASSRAVVARGAARGAARAAAAAGGGAAVCAPSGPVALGCAIIAGTAVWVGSDLLLLHVDEALNRKELTATMQLRLDELRQELEHNLLTAYDNVVDRQYTAMHADIQRTFVPAQTMR